jgi:hypothetical protein
LQEAPVTQLTPLQSESVQLRPASIGPPSTVGTAHFRVLMLQTSGAWQSWSVEQPAAQRSRAEQMSPRPHSVDSVHDEGCAPQVPSLHASPKEQSYFDSHAIPPSGATGPLSGAV